MRGFFLSFLFLSSLSRLEMEEVCGLVIRERVGRRGVVYLHHVTLVVLVVTERQQDDVALVDPHLLAKFATDVAESARPVETLSLETTVSVVMGGPRISTKDETN